MNFLSNLVLGAYVLSVILLLYLLFGTTVPRVGDAGMGYAWLTMILNLAILLLSVILYFIMSRDGSLDRISPHGHLLRPMKN
ncbi:MAG: hypothetical protein EOO04_31475 [Chitinophagaceae bacterium]|nr:MAG: hypothetical protein EOO04_31475 [Chitinophagaceae bacterium]